MIYRIYKFLSILWAFLLLGEGLCNASVPTVVVTIKPIYSLVAGIMEGVGSPTLLMNGDKSPHVQPLTPAAVHAIQAADLVVWVGPAYEAPLRRVIDTVKGNGKVVTLMDAPGMTLYSLRSGGLWDLEEDCCHGHGKAQSDGEEEREEQEDHVHDASSTDGHIWLDPHNAKTIVRVVAKKLASLDPQHKADYVANSQKVIMKLQALNQEMRTMLSRVRHIPYIAYHDGTQYFDLCFHTKAVGALMGAHHTINAQHLLEVYNYIRAHKIKCIFTEPQFPTSKIRALIDKTETKVESLDYLGVDLTADRDAYFLMMRRLADGFLKGLDG